MSIKIILNAEKEVDTNIYNFLLISCFILLGSFDCSCILHHFSRSPGYETLLGHSESK